MAKDYLNKSERCLKEAQLAFKEADYPMSVRRSQESLELAVKALLRYIGIEYPRQHDVGPALLDFRQKLPEKLQPEETVELMTELAKARGPALYGDEEKGIPSTQLFTERYAEEVLEKVTIIVRIVGEALGKA